MPLWKLLGNWKSRLRGRTTWKVAAALAAVVVVGLLLAVVPWDYRVTGNVATAYEDPNVLKAMDYTSKEVITMITCGGTFDPVKREFSDRLVVVAPGDVHGAGQGTEFEAAAKGPLAVPRRRVCGTRGVLTEHESILRSRSCR